MMSTHDFRKIPLVTTKRILWNSTLSDIINQNKIEELSCQFNQFNNDLLSLSFNILNKHLYRMQYKFGVTMNLEHTLDKQLLDMKFEKKFEESMSQNELDSMHAQRVIVMKMIQLKQEALLEEFNKEQTGPMSSTSLTQT